MKKKLKGNAKYSSINQMKSELNKGLGSEVFESVEKTEKYNRSLGASFHRAN